RPSVCPNKRTAIFAVRERRGEERMNRRLVMSVFLGCAFAFCAGIATAQKTPPPPPGAGAGDFHPGELEGDFPPPHFGERIELLGFGGMHDGKVVTGAPFSAV